MAGTCDEVGSEDRRVCGLRLLVDKEEPRTAEAAVRATCSLAGASACRVPSGSVACPCPGD
jgi:hypothetical protein